MTFTIRRRITIGQRIAIRLHQFKDNCAGVAAVEFAYLLPLLILMTYGVLETSRGVMMHKRFQRSVAMVGDLVAREETIGDDAQAANAEMGGLMKAAENAMRPYATASLKMGITAIEADPNNATITKVAWSYSHNGYTTAACGATKAMPAAGMITKGNSAILVEAQYTYTPILTNLVPGFKVSLQWNDQIANTPRSRCPNFAGKNCDC